MEAIVRPLTWDEIVPDLRPLFQALRSEEGEALILRDNIFVEWLLPGGVLRALSTEEMAEYRRPFAEPGEGRRPTLSWPRQIPSAGEPADVAALVAAYADWLATSSVPKLFVKGEPGAILTSGALVDFCRGWPAQAEVTVTGAHFLQEDAPNEIGQSIAGWMEALT